jgi:enamine deaminase RidA (YjgF/YER057c/UK114 family)
MAIGFRSVVRMTRTTPPAGTGTRARGPLVTAIDPAGVPAPPRGWYSHAVRVEIGDGALLFVSGQMALDENGEIVGAGDMARQSEHVFDLLGRILRDQGATFADVVSIRTYVTDGSMLAAYGAVRARYLTGTPPTSTTVQVAGLVRHEALVEVDLVAAVGG